MANNNQKNSVQNTNNEPEMVQMSKQDYERLMNERAALEQALADKINRTASAAGQTTQTIIDRIAANDDPSTPNIFGRCKNYLKGRQNQLCGIIQGHPFQAGRQWNEVHKANKQALYRRLGIQDTEATYTLLHPFRSLYNAIHDGVQD